jgi:OOP family OmpA-OmpF porin
MSKLSFALLPLFTTVALAADLPGSKDAPGMRRYAGSEIIGYRAPKFDEFLLPLGAPKEFTPPSYEKSLKTEGLVSRYTYAAPAGRTPTELLRNYKLEFDRLGLVTLYEKAAGEKGWFGPTQGNIEDEDQLGQILSYNEAQERVLVGKSKDTKPTYYYVFVTAYRDGVIPARLENSMKKDIALAELIVIAPEKMDEMMTFVNADAMSKSLAESGKVALYGIYFDTDKDTLGAQSQTTLAEIAKLMTADRQLKLRVVGHTDNQGKADYNLDLSRRRAASVVRELTSKYGVAADRLDSFGAGLYAPVASNDAEEGRAKNRRVELVKW